MPYVSLIETFVSPEDATDKGIMLGQQLASLRAFANQQSEPTSIESARLLDRALAISVGIPAVMDIPSPQVQQTSC